MSVDYEALSNLNVARFFFAELMRIREGRTVSVTLSKTLKRSGIIVVKNTPPRQQLTPLGVHLLEVVKSENAGGVS